MFVRKSCSSAFAFVAILAVGATTVSAAAYEEITSWSTIVDGNGSSQHYSTISDNGDTYHLLSGGSSPAVTKVDASGTASTLVTPLQWFNATGKTNVTGFYGFSVDGDDILFADSLSDNVWSVDKNSGAIAAWATKAAIDTFIGNTAPSLLSSAGAYNGDFFFYEGDTDSILTVDSTGTISTYVSDVQLTAVAGNDKVSSGLAFISNGDMIWGSSTSDSLYLWDDSASTGSSLLSLADIIAVTGNTAAGFGDVLYAPNGNVYFYESKSDGIMSFDPANAVSTLAYVLTEAELFAGPAAYDNVFGLTWHDGDLAFNMNGTRGFYAVVPEPGTLTLLLAGTLAAATLRRRNA